MTLAEVLARDNRAKVYGDPAADFDEYLVNGRTQLVRVYRSRPISVLADGDIFQIGELQVKIADFGFGTSLKVVN